tara:strand:- start:475 stop:795 length:321 start_codon:yes stop_codon:yes gene_type:complete
MKIQEYIRENGVSPFKTWFDSLNSPAAAKVTVALVRLELENTSNIKWLSGLGEYRINWGPDYLIYLLQDGEELIILFGGGTKNVNKRILKKPRSYWQSIRYGKRGA